VMRCIAALKTRKPNLCLAVLALAGTVLAQSPNGTITGTISHTMGGRVPNVEVVAKQTGTGLTFRARSSEDGTYIIPAVPIGPVQIEATAEGFKQFRRTGLVWTPSKSSRWKPTGSRRSTAV